MSVSKFLIYELTVSILCFFVLSHLRQDSPENIRGQENGMIPVTDVTNLEVDLVLAKGIYFLYGDKSLSDQR